jgi:preprotein translocase subunit YajC
MMNLFLPLLQAESAAPASGMGGGSSMLIFILLMILIFYFFMIRPQQKKQKKVEEARNSLQKGDKVVTIGGIHGKITDIKDRTFTIEIAHDVRIEVDKAAISFNEADLNNKNAAKKEEKEEEKEQAE